MFFSINAVTNNEGYFNVPVRSRFYGSSITVELKNGSEISSPLLAGSLQRFTDIYDGQSFYQNVCNTTVKLARAARESSTFTPTSPPASTTLQDPNILRPQYPSAIAISADATLAGYFLDDEPSVAVLSIYEITDAEQPSAQKALAEFLYQCRDKNKTHLVIDVSRNGGGSVVLAYDIFKQLFPTIEPYLGGQFHATPQVSEDSHGGSSHTAAEGCQINALGAFFTSQVQQSETEQPGNISALINAGRYSLFDATSVNNDSGQAFGSWDQLFEPVCMHGGCFSQQFHLNIADPINNLETGNIVISGYANNSPIAPQPFMSQNVVVFGDGHCGSSCAILLHMLKYQAKVESIVAGGRPQDGPAQAVGGVRGKRVLSLVNAITFALAFYASAPSDLIEQANKTALKDLMDNAVALLLRNAPDEGPVQVNLLNAIAQYDETQTPLQFVYEAADCRLWYQPSHLLDITSLWGTVAEQAFGLNGQEKFSLCVPGSTGHPSSLSGNPALFDNGQIANVTGYDPNHGSGSQSHQSGVTSSAVRGLSFVLVTILWGLIIFSMGAIYLSMLCLLDLGLSPQISLRSVEERKW